MFISFTNKLRLRANTTTAVTRTISIHNNVFNGSTIYKYGLIAVGYIDVTVFLNVTIIIRKCIFLASRSILSPAIYVRYVFCDPDEYFDCDKSVKIVECNFTGLQHGAITAFATNTFVECYSYRYLLGEHAYSMWWNALRSDPHNQLSLLIKNTTFTHGTKTATEVIQVSNVTVTNSQFIDNNETAITGQGSILYISGTVLFARNRGFDGGAISLKIFTIYDHLERKQKLGQNSCPFSTFILMQDYY